MSRRARRPDDPVEVARRARFEAVFREVYEPVQRYVARRTPAGSTDDVVADTMTVVWRRLDEIPADLAVAWTYGVARRCLANQRRGDARRVRLTDRLAAQAVPALVDEPFVDDELDSALAELSADDRELIRLWAWEGLAPREIAVVMDVTPNAVSIRLTRAKAQLRERLTRKSAGDGGQVGVGDTTTGSEGPQ